jgi:hypothetical protein
MDSFVGSSDSPYRWIGMVVFVAVVVGLVVYLLVGCPRYPLAAEGFRGQGSAMEGLRRVVAGCDQGRGESRELLLLLEKVSALVADLRRTDRQVLATASLPFEPAHDRLVVGELCGMCLQKAVSARDIDLVLEGWRARGLALLRLLCTSRTEAEALFAEGLFREAWQEVYDVARAECVGSANGSVVSQGSPRDAAPFEPVSLGAHGGYDGAASGWNGAV